MRKERLSDAERVIVAEMLARIGDVLARRTPERVIKAHARLVKLLELPEPHKPRRFPNYSRETSRSSERLTEDETLMLLEWLDVLMPIYNGRVLLPVMDAHLKLQRALWGLVHMPIKTTPWWRSFDRQQRAKAAQAAE
jgi:hypothetical protein